MAISVSGSAAARPGEIVQHHRVFRIGARPVLDEKGDSAGGLGAKRGFDIDWKTDLGLGIVVIIDLGGRAVRHGWAPAE